MMNKTFLGGRYSEVYEENLEEVPIGAEFVVSGE